MAEKSPMCFKLGAVVVKGGKIISAGYNHHRPHYDGAEVQRHGHRKPVSMHAEMHAIFSLTGMSPSFKKQVQGVERRVPPRAGPKRIPSLETPDPGPPIPKGSAALERRLSGATHDNEIEAVTEVEGIEEEGEVRRTWSEDDAVERQQQFGFLWERQRTRNAGTGTIL